MKKSTTNYAPLDPDHVFSKLQLVHMSSLESENVMDSISKNAMKSFQEYDDSIKAQEPRDENLTPRELEILRLVAKGKTSQKISEEISLSKHTVDTHRRNIIQKLNIASTMDWYWNARLMNVI
ncbi:MAG: LuxR C-terminal-related transcriptional regulator [Bacteroidia bacterium]